MENEHVPCGLARRRAEAAGGLAAAQAKVRQLHTDLAALDAVILPKAPRGPAADGAAGTGGTVARALLDAMRQAARPPTGPEAAALVGAARGLDGESPAVRRTMVSVVGRALRHQRGRGQGLEPARGPGPGAAGELTVG